MSFQLAEAYVELKASRTQLASDLQQAHGMVSSFLGNIGKGITQGIGMAIGQNVFELLKMGLKSSVGAAMEGEEAFAKLKIALKNNGEEVDQNAEKFEALSGALRDALNVSDESIQNLMSHMLGMGVGADKIEDMTKASLGLAEILGTDAEGGFEALNKAMNGNYMMLERRMPLLKNLQTDEEKWQYLLQRSQVGLKNQADLQETTAGKTRSMHTALHEMGESLGSAVTPAVAFLADKVAYLAKTMTAGSREALELERHLQEFAMMPSKLFGDQKDIALGNARIAKIDALLAKMDQQKAKDDALTIGNIKNQQKVVDETKNTFTKIEDVWKNYQESILKSQADKGAAGGAAGGLLKAGAKAGAAGPKNINGNPTGGADKMAAPRTLDDVKAEAAKRLKEDDDFWANRADQEGPMGGNAGVAGGSNGGANFGGRAADYYKNQRETDQKIAEFGSIAKADKLMAIKKAKEALERKAGAGDENAFDEYQKQLDNIDKFYDPKIKAEEDYRKKKTSSVDSVRSALQSRYGMEQSGPIKVETASEKQLMELMTKLNTKLDLLGGFLPG